jgi:hypothetical protein
MAHRAVLAFLDPDLKPLERIYSAWYARYFAEGWRMGCAAEKGIKSNFLTANQYACILLNAESLLLLLVWMLSDEEFRNLPFAPHGLGSQQAEEFFRRLRAMFNDPNFTVEGCLRRISYVQMDSIIRSRRKDDFVFPHSTASTHTWTACVGLVSSCRKSAKTKSLRRLLLRGTMLFAIYLCLV